MSASAEKMAVHSCHCLCIDICVSAYFLNMENGIEGEHKRPM